MKEGSSCSQWIAGSQSPHFLLDLGKRVVEVAEARIDDRLAAAVDLVVVTREHGFPISSIQAQGFAVDSGQQVEIGTVKVGSY